MAAEGTPDPIEALATTSSFAELEAALRGEKTALQVRQDTPEMDYFVVRGELARGSDARHAVQHLASLLSFDPENPAWLTLVDDVEAKYGDLVPLLEPEDPKNRYFATEALRAYLLLGRGEIGEAAHILAAIAKARPDVRYLDAWLLPILESEGLSAIDDAFAPRLLGALVNGCPEHADLPVRQREAIMGWAELAITLVDRARPASPLLLMMTAGLCRRAGRNDTALRLLDRAPVSWPTLAARALVLRHAGQLDEAVATFERAAMLDPDGGSSMLEAGDALFDAGRWADAKAIYDRVLARAPQHAWAEPSSLACAARLRSERAEPPGVIALARSGNRRAQTLANEHVAWRGLIPWPTDASTNGIVGVDTQGSGATEIRVAVTDVEAPSNRLLFHLLFGPMAKMEVVYGHVARPDPREPIGPVGVALWRRVGEQLFPALPAPPADTVAPIAELAASRFRRSRWWASAGQIAERFDATDLQLLLACVVRPPPLPRGLAVQEWIPRVQLASAFVIAQLALEEPWTESARRSGLFSILHGPMDWSTSAAIVALACLTEDEHAIAGDVHRGFARLLLARPDSGGVPWYATLLSEWPWVRGLYPRERELLLARVNEHQR